MASLRWLGGAFLPRRLGCSDGAANGDTVEATGCGSSFNVSARQCIRHGQTAACGIQFQSTGSSMVAINGEATVQNDGSFSQPGSS